VPFEQAPRIVAARRVKAEKANLLRGFLAITIGLTC
jgi:hypothetical protein